MIENSDSFTALILFIGFYLLLPVRCPNLEWLANVKTVYSELNKRIILKIMSDIFL